MDALRALGRDVWFNLGDRDLAWCAERARMLGEGLTATAALARLCALIGVRSRVLPMCDEPVRTWVCTEASGWRPFQEFMIRWGARGPITGVEHRGASEARPSQEVLAALAGASAIVIGPSNPVASIAPILAVAGMREALRAAPAPVVAVSPIVAGEVLKGPTAAFMEHAGYECDATGVARFYGELLDGLVSDEQLQLSGPAAPASLRTDTRMDGEAARAGLAERTLAFADSLGATGPARRSG
jgi:LPPG:FO 2-phospho-L-lactate transferase